MTFRDDEDPIAEMVKTGREFADTITQVVTPKGVTEMEAVEKWESGFKQMQQHMLEMADSLRKMGDVLPSALADAESKAEKRDLVNGFLEAVGAVHGAMLQAAEIFDVDRGPTHEQRVIGYLQRIDRRLDEVDSRLDDVDTKLDEGLL